MTTVLVFYDQWLVKVNKQKNNEEIFFVFEEENVSDKISSISVTITGFKFKLCFILRAKRIMNKWSSNWLTRHI